MTVRHSHYIYKYNVDHISEYHPKQKIDLFWRQQIIFQNFYRSLKLLYSYYLQNISQTTNVIVSNTEVYHEYRF